MGPHHRRRPETETSASIISSGCRNSGRVNSWDQRELAISRRNVMICHLCGSGKCANDGMPR